MESEGRAISLLPDFEIVEQSADVGEEEIADLGFFVERGLDFRKRVFQIPVLVHKGKRGADLFEARGVLPLAQEPIGLQGRRKRKTARIETRSRKRGTVSRSGPPSAWAAKSVHAANTAQMPTATHESGGASRKYAAIFC